MKEETTISLEMREDLRKASANLHAVTVFEGHNLADSPGGPDKFWMELRRREFGVTHTLAHILSDTHLSREVPLLKRLVE